MENKMGRNPVPMERIEERRQYAVKLKIAGLSSTSIMESVNKQAVTKGWGEVSRKVIETDIAEYYRNNRALTVQDFDHLDQMRQAHLDQIEKTIEKLSVYISSTKSWKPFEYTDALEKLHKMQMNLAEVQNWNYGKINQFNVNLSTQSTNKLFEQASTEFRVRTKPSAIKEFANELTKLIETMKAEKEHKDIIEGETVE